MHFAWIFTKEDWYIVRQKCLSIANIVNTGRLAQSAERGANNAEVMGSSPISTSEYKLFYLVFLFRYVRLESRAEAHEVVELVEGWRPRPAISDIFLHGAEITAKLVRKFGNLLDFKL